jgi:hypothetical protein
MPRARGPKQPIMISAPPEVLSRAQEMYRDRLEGKSVRDIAHES